MEVKLTPLESNLFVTATILGEDKIRPLKCPLHPERATVYGYSVAGELGEDGISHSQIVHIDTCCQEFIDLVLVKCREVVG